MRATQGKYQHAEAFCLMRYQCQNPHCGSRRMIWNSRDGVTPFIIGCPDCGGEMKHVDWQRDVCVPKHTPYDGQLVFVDMTEDDKRRLAEARFKQAKGTRYEIPEERKAEFIDNFIRDIHDGSPKVVTGTEYRKRLEAIPS